MATINDLDGVYSPKQKARISRKLSQRNADLKQTRVKIKPFADEHPSRLFQFKASRGNQSVGGVGSYQRKFEIGPYKSPSEIDIPGIHDAKTSKKGLSYERQHAKVKNKAMNRSFIQEAVETIGKRFPAAERLSGFRTTGAKANKGANTFDLKRLKKLSERAGRIGKRSAGKLSVLGTLADYGDFQSQMRSAKKIRDDYKKKGLLPGGST
jgi:hypothetical protein